MQNRDLAEDHVRRAAMRLKAIDVLHAEGGWADVVRESQEAVELALKGLLRACGIEPPRIHDVSEILIAEKDCLPEGLHEEVDRLARVSKDLRRDRELAFYGAEDLTPSSFYSKADADQAREGARYTVRVIEPVVLRR